MRRSYRSVPDNPTGYPINPCREWFSLIVPETTTNLFTNPSFETGTSGWTFSESAAGGGYSRVSTYQYKGAYCALLVPSVFPLSTANYGQIVGPAVVSGTLYTMSFHIRKANRGAISSAEVRAYVNGAAVPFDRIAYVGDGWHRCVKTFQATATTAPGLRVYSAATFPYTSSYYVDAAQLEAKGYATTYCDGDQLGLLPLGLEPVPYYWTGTPHGSTSVRSATTRSGGRELTLDRYGFTLLGLIGAGMAPRANVSTELGLLDGSLYQTTIRELRTLTLAGAFEAANPYALSKARGALRAALQHDLTGVKQPALWSVQRYQDAQATGQRALFAASYADGLEGNEGQIFSEKAAIKLAQYQPGMTASADRGTTSAGGVLVSSYIVGNVSGAWSGLGASLNGSVLCQAIGPDNKLYIGGSFTSAGGGSANRIAVYDGNTWSTLGTGLNGTVNGLAFNAAGSLYVTGNFTTAGGGAANYIAVWNGSTWAALGSGLNALGRAVIIRPSTGGVYVTGDFTTAGGGAAAYIATWNGSAWAALGSGLNAAGYALAVDGASNIYVAGNFTTAGGSAYVRVAKWNDSTWSGLGAGLNGSCLSIVFDGAGNLYAGGSFTTAGGVTVARVAVWNGVAWQAMADGLNNTVFALAYDSISGIVYAGGQFTASGSLPMPSGTASWNGSTWAALPLLSSEIVASLAVAVTTLYIGFFSVTTSITGNTTAAIVNPGTMAAPITIAITYTSPTTVYTLVNYTTGRAVYFSLATQASERVVISYVAGTLRVVAGTLRGSGPLRGAIAGAVLPASDPDAFLLIPGSNTIGILTNQTSATVDYWLTPLFDDLDGLTGK